MADENVIQLDDVREEENVSPYLRRRPRTFEEYLREKKESAAGSNQISQTDSADTRRG